MIFPFEVLRQKYRQTIADTLLPHLISQVFKLFFSVTHPDCHEATRRILDFSLGGLEEVAKECAKLNIEFHLLQDMTKPMADRVMDFVKESKVGCVVTDFSPLRAHRY